jgi:predicted N-acetyltransferase YhbS
MTETLSPSDASSLAIECVSFESPEYADSLRFRERVLRVPLGMVLRPEDVEGEASHYHIVALLNKAVVGTVVLKPLSVVEMKLRQMAVDPTLQGHGLGRRLVQFAERLALEKGFHTMVLHGRVSALGFYESMGYQATGEPFMEVSVPSIKVVKRLLSSGS